MSSYRFVDQYSLLHFATGIVAYFFAVPLRWWVVGHTAFELFENTPTGMRISRAIPMWPGGKQNADSVWNMIGDSVSAILGWVVANWVDGLATKRHLYHRRI